MPRLRTLFVLLAATFVAGCKAERHWHDGLYSASARVVGHALRDPSSAQWMNRRKVQLPGDPRRVAVCGQVNAKNAFGGYVGYTPFFSAWQQDGETGRHVISMLLTPSNASGFEPLFREHCGGEVIHRME
jgi:hypothetical protein